MTNWLDSTSLKKTSWPVSGHLIQRFSGVSRRRKLRIFGRTTLEIQFMLFSASCPAKAKHSVTAYIGIHHLRCHNELFVATGSPEIAATLRQRALPSAR